MLEQLLLKKLAERRETNLYRTRHLRESAQMAEMYYDGKPYLSFYSNDYLGLANHPEINRALQTAVEKIGTGSGASHLLGGHSTSHHALEEELAAFTGRERALLFSTGYMANIGVITALFGKGDAIFSDRLNHASLVDAARFSGAKVRRYAHADAEHLEKYLSQSTESQKLIVSDGVFSVDGDIAPLPELVTLAKQSQACLMIDDAHGFGAIGVAGRGSCSLFDLKANDVPLLVGTLGKAFGVFGAFVAGSETIIESLIQFSRSYIYTTAMPAAVAEAARVSLRLVQEEEWRRDHLRYLIDQFRNGASQLGITLLASDTPVQVLLIGDAKRAVDIHQALMARGILVGLIRPPTVPAQSSRLRITLTARHTTSQVEHLLANLAELQLTET